MCIMQSLSRDSNVPAIEKSIYLAVLTESPRSIQELAKFTGIEYKRRRQHCAHLASAGWLRLDRKGASVFPHGTLPTSAEIELAAVIREAIKTAPYKGEAVAKALVSWVVAPRVRILFNVRLAHLRSSTTKQLLEYDIYIAEWNWAVEYFGDQHFGPTRLFPDVAEFVKRSQRDHEKAKLSRKNNTRLSIITKDDLTLAKIDAVIPPEIPRRGYDPRGPVAQMLAETGKEIAASKDCWDRE